MNKIPEEIPDEIMQFEDEKFTVQVNMIKYGGGFVQALGQALARADAHNVMRIKWGFPDYWEEYLNFQSKVNNS